MLKSYRKSPIVWFSLLLAMSAGYAWTLRQNYGNKAEFAQYAGWGAEVFAEIERDCRVSNSTDYYENEQRNSMMTAWPGGLYLMALATAARVEPDRYHQALHDMIAELDNHYWNTTGPVPGYDSEHQPRIEQKRYYDDNCWITLGLIDAYQVSPTPQLMARIKETYRYIFSGEDQTLGGGIYWREVTGGRRRSKNTCSNAPAAVVALKMYALTGERKYLDDGKRIMEWLQANLQDPADHLFWDNKRMSGQISRAKFTYNTGMPIQAWVLLYRHTRDPKYLKEAQAAAGSALQHWYDPDKGTFNDGGAFVFTLTEGLMRLAEVDDNPRWRECARRTARFVHDQGKDASGRYPEHWNQAGNTPYQKYMVRHSAPAAYLFWRLAEEAQPRDVRKANMN